MKKIFATVLVLMMVFVSCGASAEWLYATKGDTYVHVGPDIETDSLGVFLKGEKIWVKDHIYTSDGRNWCKVNYLGKIGYISDRYSSYDVYNPNSYTEVGDSSYTEYEEYEGYPEEYYGYYEQFTDQEEFEFRATKNTKVYAWADSKATVIGSLLKGTTVWGSIMYTSNGKAYLEVVWDEYQLGYIPTNALRLTEELFDGSYPSFAEKMRITGGMVNVRADTDINSKDIGTVYEGDVFYVSYYVCVDNGERRIWAYCTDEQGNGIGYISCKYLEVAHR